MKILNYELNTSHIIIVMLIGVILLLAKCNSDSKNELKSQSIISQNNIEVMNDSIKTYKTKYGSIISERGILIAEKKDLKKLNKNLYDKVVDLEKTISGLKPKIVIVYETKYIHDTLYLESSLYSLNDSTHLINFSKDTIYNGKNSRSLAGEVDISLLVDSTNKYNKLKINSVKLTKDIINMEATLAIGMKDDKLKVWLKTDYPGFEANKIEAVTLDPNIHPELRELNNNKRFSVGPYIGVGIGQNLTISPSIGVGIIYSLFKF